MVAISKLKPGDVVFDARKQKMGNTTMRRMVVWRVHIKEVHEGHVIASWNGNAARAYRQYEVSRWTRTPPKRTAERERFDALSTNKE